MKTLGSLFIVLFYLYSNLLFSQQVENLTNAKISSKFLELDQYYQELYENANGNYKKLKGTGFMPYQRERHFYEQRRDVNGILDLNKRWNIFKEIRLNPKNGGEPIANWENLGPIDMDGHGGRMISHAFDPLVPEVVWAGSASGGLWLSENGGDSWSPKTDGIPSTGVGAIAIHPQDSNTLIIGTGEGFISFGRGGIGAFKSTDKGLTWLPTSFVFPASVNVSVLKLAWHPTNHNIIWMAATNGLWKSEDQGENWISIMSDGTNHQNFIFDDIIIQLNNPDIMFVSQENVGVLKSVDGGDNFTLLNNGIPTTDINFISMDQCVSQPNILYASITRLSDFSLHGLYKTSDNGDSWSKITNTPEAFCTTNSLGTFCQGWYDNTIGVSPENPDILFFGGITFWVSNNGGLNWIQKDRSLNNSSGNTLPCLTYIDHHDIGFDPHNSGTFYSFNDGGISKSEDNGTCWTSVNNGLVTAQFNSVASGRSNPDILIGGLQDHGLFGANVGTNLQWERWGFFDGANVAVDHTNPNFFFGTWINGIYWRSTNGTNSFANQITNGMNLNENTSFSHFAPIRMHPTNRGILLGSTQGGIYRSSNSGSSWSKNHSANVVTDLDFSFADPNICYAASWNNSNWFFHRSNDTGITWEVTNNSPGWRVTDVKTSGLNSQIVFASRNGINTNTAHIYKSINGGDNWQAIQGDLPDIQVNAIAVDFQNDDILYAATDLGVFITINGGINWTEFNDNLPVTYTTDIEFNPIDRKIRVSTYGRGIWVTDAFGDPLAIDNFTIDKINEFIIYPNPTKSNFTISFNSSESENIEVSIYNYLRQKIAKIYTGTSQIGANKITINTDNISLHKGIYIVGIKSLKKSYYKKIILK
jgi:photosystem II stability/assembly factor-like uncharacterized protein